MQNNIINTAICSLYLYIDEQKDMYMADCLCTHKLKEENLFDIVACDYSLVFIKFEVHWVYELLNMAQIALFVGSVRHDRQGIKVACWIEEKLIARGHIVYSIDPLELNLPLLDRMYV